MSAPLAPWAELADGMVTLYHADVMAALTSLPDETVDMCCTSPPYWSLRDYGDPQQLGLEETPELYVERLVDVFREVRRVLKPHGVCWLNLGDSFVGSGHNGGGANVRDDGHVLRHGSRATRVPAKPNVPQTKHPNVSYPADAAHRRAIPDGLKPKDMVGIPWRVAFALQADGWWLRSDVVWSKDNAMPESVTDRPTMSHEYVFLLAKSQRYFFDGFAVKEPLAAESAARADRSSRYDDADVRAGVQYKSARPRINRSWNTERVPPEARTDDRPDTNRGAGVPWCDDGGGRNVRSVWRIPTQPYHGAHFAVFPEALAERCIKAGSSEHGVCPECGAPWRRVVEQIVPTDPGRGNGSKLRDAEGLSARAASAAQRQLGGSYQKQLDAHPPRTAGWEPTCGCGSTLTATDLEVIRTPLGERIDDPTMTRGRRGFARSGRDQSGARMMRRWEQRAYAEQLKALPIDVQAMLAEEAGPAWEHYLRSDAGGRPPAPELLERWLEDELLEPPVPPVANPPEPVPAVILDPFSGSGTTCAVARRLGRRSIGVELSRKNLDLARIRITAWYKKPSRPEPVPEGAQRLFEEAT